MSTDDEKTALRLAQLNAAGMVPMTAEEILAGEAQAGVARPNFLKDHEDDGTIDRRHSGGDDNG